MCNIYETLKMPISSHIKSFFKKTAMRTWNTGQSIPFKKVFTIFYILVNVFALDFEQKDYVMYPTLSDPIIYFLLLFYFYFYF